MNYKHKQQLSDKEAELTQSWYWTEEWQSKEQEAELDLINEDYLEFDTIEEFIKFLDMLKDVSD